MIKKELKEIIFPALIRFGVFMIPVLFMWTYLGVASRKFDNLIFATSLFGVSLYWVANHFGTQAFKTEFRDNAFEYLFSFPYSRYRILYYKIFPRLAVLLLLTVVFEILALFVISRYPLSETYRTFPFHPICFPVWVTFFFLWGFCLGLIEDRSQRALMNFLVFFLFILVSLGISSLLAVAGIRQVAFQGVLSTLIGAFLVVVVLGIAFFSLFRKFDLGKVHLYGKKFIYRVLPLLVMFGLVSAIILTKFGLH